MARYSSGSSLAKFSFKAGCERRCRGDSRCKGKRGRRCAPAAPPPPEKSLQLRKAEHWVVYFEVFQQLDHGLAHGFADVHVDFGVAAVVAVAAAALCHVVGVDRGDIAFELRVLAAGAVHREMALEHLSGVVGPALGGFANGGETNFAFGALKSLRTDLMNATRFCS